MNIEEQIKLIIVFLGMVIIAFIMEFFLLSKHVKYKILIFSIYLVILEPIENLHLGYYNLNEMVLQILAINLLIYHKEGIKGPVYRILVSFIFFTMIASLINTEMYYWFRFFLNPLLTFISIKYLTTSEEQFWRLIRTCRNSLLVYGLIYMLSYKFGNVGGSQFFGNYITGTAAQQSLFGFGSRTATFQGFVFDLSSNQIASFISLLIIISFILYLYSNDSVFKKALNQLIILIGLLNLILPLGCMGKREKSKIS